MLCQHNFIDNVGQKKNWVVCSFYLQVYFKHEKRFKVVVFNFFFFIHPKQKITAEYVGLLDKP